MLRVKLYCCNGIWTRQFGLVKTWPVLVPGHRTVWMRFSLLRTNGPIDRKKKQEEKEEEMKKGKRFWCWCLFWVSLSPFHVSISSWFSCSASSSAKFWGKEPLLLFCWLGCHVGGRKFPPANKHEGERKESHVSVGDSPLHVSVSDCLSLLSSPLPLSCNEVNRP